MNLSQLFAILRARRGTILLIMLATLLLTLPWLLLRPTHYTARAAVLVDVRSPDPVAGNGGGMAGLIAPSYMATQIDIVRSDRIADRVVQVMGLEKNPEEMKRWQEATKGKGSARAWFVRELQQGLDVKPARETNIINIAWTGGSPAEAAKVANAFAQAYLDTSLELRTDPAKRYSTWFEEQLRTARQNLEEAQGKLSAYQQRSGVVSADERLDFETSRLNELATQLSSVQGQSSESSSKRARGDTVSDAMQSPLINGLRADVARLEAKQQEAAANFGPGHPQMQRINAELNSLRNLLRAETARVSTSINTAYDVSKSREREIRDAMYAQKSRVMEMNKHRDQLSLLKRDVETAQKAFEAVSAGASQSKLQSLTNQTNMMRLVEATEPLRPSGPTNTQAMLVALVGGLLLALAGSLLLELAFRRVRSAEDLSMASQLPVLAAIPGEQAPTSFLRLPAANRRLAIAHGSAA